MEKALRNGKITMLFLAIVSGLSMVAAAVMPLSPYA
jgi:hypothetical protein